MGPLLQQRGVKTSNMFFCLLTAKLSSDDTFFTYFMTEKIMKSQSWFVQKLRKIHLWIKQKIVGMKQIQCVLTLLISKDDI